MSNQEYYLAGIAGPSCTGKTTLMTELKYRVQPPPTIYSFDEYDLFPSGSKALEEELRKRRIINWEDPSLFDEEAYVEHLAQIKAGLPVVLETHSRESIERGDRVCTVVPSGLNIVEGIFIYHDPRARELFDLRFFIDISMEEMVRRRLARTPKGSTDPWDDPDYIRGEMVRGTQTYVMPQREHAHVVLDGLLPTIELAEMVISEIRHRKSGLIAY